HEKFLDTNKVEITNGKYEEFSELLRVIYPNRAQIADHSAECLLKLGKQFNITFLIDRAEKFLIDTIGWCNKKKLSISDKYMLSDLHDHCLNKLTTLQDFIDVKESSIYYDLSFKMKAELFEEMIRKFSD
ncbi:hypothetical protein PMAYCL1PPCAC_24846, partial [Pristionchus mayeri]